MFLLKYGRVEAAATPPNEGDGVQIPHPQKLAVSARKVWNFRIISGTSGPFRKLAVGEKYPELPDLVRNFRKDSGTFGPTAELPSKCLELPQPRKTA